MSINERSPLVRSSSFLASCVFQASQTDFSAATKASELVSVGLASVSFASCGGGRVALGEPFGSIIGFSPWKAASHLPPLRTQIVAARAGLGMFAGLPSAAVHVPSEVLR